MLKYFLLSISFWCGIDKIYCMEGSSIEYPVADVGNRRREDAFSNERLRNIFELLDIFLRRQQQVIKAPIAQKESSVVYRRFLQTSARVDAARITLGHIKKQMLASETIAQKSDRVFYEFIRIVIEKTHSLIKKAEHEKDPIKNLKLALPILQSLDKVIAEEAAQHENDKSFDLFVVQLGTLLEVTKSNLSETIKFLQ